MKMKRIVSIIICFLALAVSASAQTSFLETLRSVEDGKGRVVVMQSLDIDTLINNNRPIDSTAVAVAEAAEAEKADAAKDAAVKKAAGTTAGAGQKQATFRIQVFSGGNTQQDRLQAERAGKIMKSHFPASPVFVHFYSPSWKCRMGNFTDEQEARRVLAQVKALGFPQACILGNAAGRRGK